MMEKRINCHKVTNENGNSFVGIKIKNDVVDLYYPESFNIAEVSDIKNFRNDALAIIKSINLAQTMSKADKSSIDEISNNKNFTLLSYMWLIRDYLNNGFYVNTEKNYSQNKKGKVNWKRTLDTQPIISNGNFIYDKIVVEAKNEIDDIITEAHRYCIYLSYKRIGWLFGLNERSIQIAKVNDAIINKYIKSVKSELKTTFEDLKRLRLNHMLKTLNGCDNESNLVKEYSYGVDSYFYVYERMIDSLFGNVADIKNYNPIGEWNLTRITQKFPSSNLRPDTIFIREKIDSNTKQKVKIAYIIDSKYYRFGTTFNPNDLPTTTSIQKQITYAEELINNHGVKNVWNAFILPFNKESNKAKKMLKVDECSNLEYLGFASSSWNNSEGKDHNKIHTFLIDLKHVAMNYAYGSNDLLINKLVNDIADAIK